MGYPVIMNGDHAEFEAEWAASGRPDHERPDWPLPSFDAQDWAKAFCKINPGVPEDVMIGWFANALMRGFDEHAARTAHTETAIHRRD
jgi:hypothetical protein